MNEEIKIQYILDENMELAEIPKDSALEVEYPINYKLKNAFEVFVRIDGTENYWISNYGRCVNNYRRKGFFLHKEGKVHYTIFEIERCKKKGKNGRVTDKEEVNTYKRETSPEDLVAEVFLKSYRGRYKVWHKDGEVSNNWYKNLIYVNPEDYKNLKTGTVKLSDLNLEQEYIEYKNKASNQAYTVYNGIKTRCSDAKRSDGIGKCYDEADMWQVWWNNPKSFVKWYLEHYYEVEGEVMAVDKDLFGNGSKFYSPENCCILPQGLNNLIVNCKKHYYEDGQEDDILPLGVRQNHGLYYGEITFTGTTKTIRLSDWNTPEEAFAEYKLMKQADILLVAARYKEKIPDYIYDGLLKLEVKPY